MGKKLDHLGIIIDGNRRYAQKSKMQLDDTYKLGAKKVYEAIKYVFGKTDISELSVYALSYDNLSRKSAEVDAILKMQKAAFDEWAVDTFFDEKRVKVRFIGDMRILPPELLDSCERLKSKTSNNGDRTLNILIAYSGHREISYAVERLINHAMHAGGKTTDVNALIYENLEVKKPVDLVIRTASGYKFSGFLPWQTEYAELCVLDMLWPEVEMEDIKEAIENFKNNEEKYGL